LNPELFTAMVTEDIVPLSGCDLFWTRVGERFVGADEPLRCHTASHTSEAAARTLLAAELKSTELALSGSHTMPTACWCRDVRMIPCIAFARATSASSDRRGAARALVLQVRVQPIKDRRMPLQTVRGFQHPMVLVRKDHNLLSMPRRCSAVKVASPCV